VLVREVQPRQPSPVLLALALGAASSALAAIFAAAFLSLIACTPPRVLVMPQRCESRLVRPAMLCFASLQFDGCRWRCTDEPVEMGSASLYLGADIEAVRSMSLCASPTYCEAK
jgi:hypothetical protein